MPKRRPKKPEKKPDEGYEAFRAQWERAKPHRREWGRGKPGDANYRPPMIGSRPHRTKAADFLDELLWLGAYVGDDCFGRAYVAVQEAGAIKDGKWAKDFRPRPPPPGLIIDPFYKCVSHVARKIHQRWSQRAACAWAVATFDLPGASFDAAVAQMRAALRKANAAGLFPV